MSDTAPLAEKAKVLYDRLNQEAKAGGYNLNPDVVLTLMLCEGLVTNTERYGYMACPCRLASGDRGEDLDIICPCDYRDLDLAEFGTCYCGLYVSAEVVAGRKEAVSIPERRPSEEERKVKAERKLTAPTKASIEMWRCSVCGYLCAIENPPDKCPICKADSDRFRKFAFGGEATIWRCKVCGYLCAMENPPEKCPVCKADSDRFELFSC